MKKLRLHLLTLCMIMQVSLEGKKTTSTLSTQDIREKFLQYFKKADYKEINPTPIISENGALVTSGLTPFRNVLLEKEEAPADKIVSIQLCMRSYPPYNDQDKVVTSDQHLTSFDSATFFSFDNPSNKQTIPLVYSFLTTTLGIDPERLFVTVHREDHSSLIAWKKLILRERIFRLGDQDNIWQEQGVSPAISGYSTEVFYDKRPQGERKKLPRPDDFRNGTMTELVNIVSHSSTINTPDPITPPFPPTPWMSFSGKSFGIPRMAAVVQQVPSVYETDEIKPIMQQVEKSTGKIYAQADEQTRAHMRVMCDHMRTVPLLIHNGVKPSDTTPAGNALKDLLERAQNSANIVAPKKKNILPEIAQVALQQLSPSHPEIRKNKAKILKTIRHETDSKK